MPKKNIVLGFIILIGIGSALYFSSKPKTTAVPGETGSTKQITDFSGETKTLKTPCEKVVLPRSRDIYELSAVLGDKTADKIAAWGPDLKEYDQDAYNKYVERFPSLKEKPLIGNIFDNALDAESVVSYNPDLVVMDNYLTKFSATDKLKQAGLPLVFFDQSNKLLENPQKGITIYGQLFGQEARAKEISDYIDGQINIVTSRLAKIGKKMPTVYMERGDAGAKVYGSTWGLDDTSWSAMIRYAGGMNIADKLTGEMMVVDPEFLLRENPDAIIITGANWEAVPDSMKLGYYTSKERAQESLEAFTQRPGWNQLKAVKNGKMYAIHHGLIMHDFGFAALQQMAKWFYPEEFADIDPEANLKEFHDRFMPFEYSGTWFTGLDR
jgi:iron complex transport system substrate-binding protein